MVAIVGGNSIGDDGIVGEDGSVGDGGFVGDGVKFRSPCQLVVNTGGGVKELGQTRRPLSSLLPGGVTWLQDSVSTFQPSNNSLQTEAGDTVTYDWLVIATGLVLRSEREGGQMIFFLQIFGNANLA